MIDAIAYRKSIRSFKPGPIEKEKVEDILNAGLSSPSAHHKNPWEFIAVTENEKKEKLSKATPWSSFIKDAPLVIAVAGDPSSDQWIEDLSIASQNMVIQAFSYGIGSCYAQIYNIDHYPEKKLNSEEYVKQILDIPAKYRVLFLLPFGYPTEQLTKKESKSLPSHKIHFEKF